MFGARGLGHYLGMSEEDVGVVEASCAPAGLEALTRALAALNRRDDDWVLVSAGYSHEEIAALAATNSPIAWIAAVRCAERMVAIAPHAADVPQDEAQEEPAPPAGVSPPRAPAGAVGEVPVLEDDTPTAAAGPVPPIRDDSVEVLEVRRPLPARLPRYEKVWKAFIGNVTAALTAADILEALCPRYPHLRFTVDLATRGPYGFLVIRGLESSAGFADFTAGASLLRYRGDLRLRFEPSGVNPRFVTVTGKFDGIALSLVSYLPHHSPFSSSSPGLDAAGTLPRHRCRQDEDIRRRGPSPDTSYPYLYPYL